MRNLNIRQKILGVALAVLLPMLVVAGYSVHQADVISQELEAVALRKLPVTEAVARINVRVLEQGVLLERLYVAESVEDKDVDHVAVGFDRLASHDEAIRKEFDKARELLRVDPSWLPRVIDAVESMSRHLGAIEEAYSAFDDHAIHILETRANGDRAKFDELLDQLSGRQDSIYDAIAELRRNIEDLTGDAVDRAEHNQERLVYASVGLTLVAAIFGAGLALSITSGIVSNVRRLVGGAEQVESGQLDAHVQVSSGDEIGKLTHSFNKMVEGLRLKERIKDTFGKYMDPRIVSGLLDHPEFTDPGGERREMTVMFIDLKGFTSISEKLPPDKLVEMVNRFFTHMTSAISDKHGVVDKFMGDAVMAFWGPPFCDANAHARLACEAAVDALRHLDRFRSEVAVELGAELIEIDLRIGISTGDMIVGTIGSDTSRSFTVMGDPVNLGSRLEGANKAYGTRVMLSERTREIAGAEIAVRELDAIRVKGKETPVRVFELLGMATDTLPLTDATLSAFEDGLAAYRAQDWGIAARHFESVRQELPDDPAAAVYLERIAQLRDAPPGADWDGVWVFETK